MRTLWIVAVWLMCVEGSVIELGKMIVQLTNKTPASYVSYGCFCGGGDRGKPKDATDRCCFVHSCCYDTLPDCSPKTDQYKYKWENGEIICENSTSCKKRICECDKAVAICLRENLKTYNKKYKIYPNILCRGEPDKC
uniref:Phospholipase A2 Group IIA c n=1 Tax=Echis coloratus TaxID=64175 RepID=A0A0A1WC82_ECHCO